MSDHSTENDADLVRDTGASPAEATAGPDTAAEIGATQAETPLSDPVGGGTAAEPTAAEAEETGDPAEESASAEIEAEETGDSGEESASAEIEAEAAGDTSEESASTEAGGEETGDSGEESASAETGIEGESAAAPVLASGAAMDEPPVSGPQEAGAAGDEAVPAEVGEEELADIQPVAAAAAAGAAIEEPAVVEEGGEPSAAGGDAAPAEADGAPIPAAAAAAGAAIEEPAVVEEGMEPSAAGGDAAPAEADGAPIPAAAAAGLDLQDKKRRRLLIGLVVLAVLLIAAGALFVRYLLSPGPLPDLLPLPVDVTYRPHYLFSIYGVDKPVGVAVSPDAERIYVTETSGEREVKVFDRDGRMLGSFSPPSTGPAERAPVYLAVDPEGRVFVTDRLQRAVFVYDQEGKLLDAILGPDLTLTEYVSKHVDGFQPDSLLAYNFFGHLVSVQAAGHGEQVLPAPEPADWAPLGVRVDEQGSMLLTDVAEGRHAVREFPGNLIMASTWQEFDPPELVFGAQGHGSGEFMYPNSAVADSKGRIYVTDGNNGRISVWDGLGSFLFNFGRGVGESALSLPRGAAVDSRDRLHIVDAVDQSVKVYDVSEPEPRFLFAFGDWGTKDGEFNYPGDIALDGTGRLYIADRENNRIQVWSY